MSDRIMLLTTLATVGQLVMAMATIRTRNMWVPSQVPLKTMAKKITSRRLGMTMKRSTTLISASSTLPPL